MQAIHAKKLEQALRSHERFPINLEWMVDVFKYPPISIQQMKSALLWEYRCLHCSRLTFDKSRYKHISSLTTHLKRHFKMSIHYNVRKTKLYALILWLQHICTLQEVRTRAKQEGVDLLHLCGMFHWNMRICAPCSTQKDSERLGKSRYYLKNRFIFDNFR